MGFSVCVVGWLVVLFFDMIPVERDQGRREVKFCYLAPQMAGGGRILLDQALVVFLDRRIPLLIGQTPFKVQVKQPAATSHLKRCHRCLGVTLQFGV